MAAVPADHPLYPAYEAARQRAREQVRERRDAIVTAPARVGELEERVSDLEAEQGEMRAEMDAIAAGFAAWREAMGLAAPQRPRLRLVTDEEAG